MRKIIRTGILSLLIVLSFMLTAAPVAGAADGRFIPPADRGRVFMHEISIQAKHNYSGDYPIIHVSKHDLTLNKGEFYTLKYHYQYNSIMEN